jgi:DNA-binding NarL/FixJ family response regulator
MDYKNRDGINLISEIRAKEAKDSNSKQVPVIVFSEHDEEQFFQSAIKSGATACYSKNKMSLNELIRNLQTHIS